MSDAPSMTGLVWVLVLALQAAGALLLVVASLLLRRLFGAVDGLYTRINRHAERIARLEERSPRAPRTIAGETEYG